MCSLIVVDEHRTVTGRAWYPCTGVVLHNGGGGLLESDGFTQQRWKKGKAWEKSRSVVDMDKWDTAEQHAP